MKYYIFAALLLLGNLTVFSQTKEITFADNTRLVTTNIESKSFDSSSKKNIKIANKRFYANFSTYGKGILVLSTNTLAAISKKNKMLARDIKRGMTSYSIEQDGNEFYFPGLNSITDLKKDIDLLNSCFEKKSCKVECEAIIVQIEQKDKTENVLILKSIKFLKD